LRPSKEDPLTPGLPFGKLRVRAVLVYSGSLSIQLAGKIEKPTNIVFKSR